MVVVSLVQLAFAGASCSLDACKAVGSMLVLSLFLLTLHFEPHAPIGRVGLLLSVTSVENHGSLRLRC